MGLAVLLREEGTRVAVAEVTDVAVRHLNHSQTVRVLLLEVVVLPQIEQSPVADRLLPDRPQQFPVAGESDLQAEVSLEDDVLGPLPRLHEPVIVLLDGAGHQGLVSRQVEHQIEVRFWLFEPEVAVDVGLEAA